MPAVPYSPTRTVDGRPVVAWRTPEGRFVRVEQLTRPPEPSWRPVLGERAAAPSAMSRPGVLVGAAVAIAIQLGAALMLLAAILYGWVLR